VQQPTRRLFLSVSLPLYIWIVAMVTGSSLPGNALPAATPWRWDTCAHFGEYLVLTVLLYRYLVLAKRVSPGHARRLCLLWGIAFGAYDELHQFLIPLRDCTLLDFGANAAGVIAGVAAVAWVLRWKGPRWSDS
jgi:VanZ family protein